MSFPPTSTGPITKLKPCFISVRLPGLVMAAARALLDPVLTPSAGEVRSGQGDRTAAQEIARLRLRSLDGPLRLGAVTQSAAIAADVALFPIQAGPFGFCAVDRDARVSLDEVTRSASSSYEAQYVASSW